MKTIQTTIDEVLLAQVDKTIKDLGTTRSAFIRKAIEQALKNHHIRRLEERDEIGYQIKPAQSSDVDEWLRPQAIEK